jgi:D-beta-D-heptose 7-phosphate kinase/D-beta-D-heptose 1-phosphate adenosyltransferase
MSNAIIVIGDLMIDRYWNGGVSRISPEAPVPVLEFKNSYDRLGGAANVALNLSKLNIEVKLFGIIGKDEVGESFKLITTENSINIDGLVESQTLCTIQKLRLLNVNHQLLRVDFEFPKLIYSKYANQILANLKQQFNLANHKKFVVLSDYNKGVLNDCREIIDLCLEYNCYVVVDPKGNDFKRYQRSFILTPNFKEFCNVVGDCLTEKEIDEKAFNLIQELSIDYLLITRSEKGMTLFSKNKQRFHFEASAKDIFDVTGAGDTVIAVLTYFLNDNFSVEESVRLSNIAAGIVVSKVGTSFVTLDEILKKI